MIIETETRNIYTKFDNRFHAFCHQVTDCLICIFILISKQLVLSCYDKLWYQRHFLKIGK